MDEKYKRTPMKRYYELPKKPGFGFQFYAITHRYHRMVPAVSAW
jgi:hypothetical protein